MGILFWIGIALIALAVGYHLIEHVGKKNSKE